MIEETIAVGGVMLADAPPLPQFDLSRLSYGDLRRLQTVDPSNLEGLAMLDTILEKAVIGGMDAIPVTKLKPTIVALMAEITQAMQGNE